jgi:epoxyqueuosine reductase
MQYQSRKAEDGQLLRLRTAIPFPWARSVIVCLASYHSEQPPSTNFADVDKGWIARYAWSSRRDPNGNLRPSDYHKVLLKRLKALDAGLHDRLGGFTSRAFVDTGPVVERSLATAAGLGWIGKNNCLIHPQLGSYVFLAVLFTSLEIEQEAAPAKPVRDRCGSCRRCLDACPTGALLAPHSMDARRCIAYLTIEHRGKIDAELQPGMGHQIFGCDLCQEVCPWNRKAPAAADPELEPRTELVNPSLEALAAMNEAEFERLFNGSPIRRTGFNGLRRNLAIAMGNSGLKRFVPFLGAWSISEDEGLRAAAQKALEKLRAL